MRIVCAALVILAVTAVSFSSCPALDPGAGAYYFQVRFTGDMAEQRKFGIGKSSDDLLIDPGYFANGTTTGYYAAPADVYDI